MELAVFHIVAIFPMFSDLEVIALSMAAEIESMDSGKWSFGATLLFGGAQSTLKYIANRGRCAAGTLPLLLLHYGIATLCDGHLRFTMCSA